MDNDVLSFLKNWKARLDQDRETVELKMKELEAILADNRRKQENLANFIGQMEEKGGKDAALGCSGEHGKESSQEA